MPSSVENWINEIAKERRCHILPAFSKYVQYVVLNNKKPFAWGIKEERGYSSSEVSYLAVPYQKIERGFAFQATLWARFTERLKLICFVRFQEELFYFEIRTLDKLKVRDNEIFFPIKELIRVWSGGTNTEQLRQRLMESSLRLGRNQEDIWS